MTPKEAATSQNAIEQRAWIIDPARTPRELLEFFADARSQLGWTSGSTEFVHSAVEVRIAEQQIYLAEQQSKSAQILENQTRALVKLTWALVWLTVGLLVFTVGFAVFHQSPQPQDIDNNPTHTQNQPQ